MKATIDLSTAPLLTIHDVGELCRNVELAKRGVHHGWLRHCVKSAEGTSGIYLYRRQEVDAFLTRIMSGEVPPSRKVAA